MEIANKPENLIQLTAVEELTGKSIKTLISLAESGKTPIYANLGIGSGVPAVPIAIKTSKGASARLAIRHHKSTADERELEVSNLPKGVRQVAQQILILGNHFIQIHPDDFRELLEVTDHRQIQIHYVLLTLDFWEPKSKAEVERLLKVSATEESRELLFWFRRPVTVKLSNLYIPNSDFKLWSSSYFSFNRQKKRTKKSKISIEQTTSAKDQNLDELDRILIEIDKANKGRELEIGDFWNHIKREMNNKKREYDRKGVLKNFLDDKRTVFMWQFGKKPRNCSRRALANRVSKLRAKSLISMSQ